MKYRDAQSSEKVSEDLIEVNRQLKEALTEQHRVSKMVIQKDLRLSELNDQLNRQVNQLKVLQEMGNKVRSIVDTHKALDVFARGLVFDLRFAGLFILLGTPPFHIASHYSYKKIPLEDIGRNKVVIDAYDTGERIVIETQKTKKKVEKDLGRLVRLNSLAILPLQVRGKKYGVLVCGFDDPYQGITESDIEFLEIVSNSISINLENIDTEERQRYIDALKSEFVSIASHQLRTPLSIVKWILKMTLDGDLGEQNEEQQEFLRKAYTSNERMIDLVNDLLNVSRLEEGRMEFHIIEFQLDELLKEVIDQYKVLFVQKGIAIKTKFKGAKGVVIKGDREKLSLVFTNLVDNAVKFTRKGGSVTLSITREKNKDVSVSIADTGMGIDEKDRGKLFTKFFRSDTAKRMQTEGSGLGLFIAKSIMYKHNGKITVTSQLGKGTTFVCTLPRI